jgi:ABC-type multidrug transport system fused ATPase/permease subunit
MLFIGFEIAFLSLLNIGVLLKNRYLHFYLVATLFFSFLINIVTLSRAFPLVGLVILFLMHLLLDRLKIKWRKSRWFLVASTYLFLSVSSILLVSAYRANFFENNQTVLHQSIKINADTKPSAGWHALIFGRWIGFEGVASTVSYPGTGIPLLFDSVKEIKSYGAPSFYDRVVVAADSTYFDIAQRNYYAITLPGIIGYLNYSGISLIVLLGTFLVSIFSFRFLRYIELYSNNLMVGGFCAYLLAYRLVSFGYVPMDTYLFLLALVAGVVWSIFLKKIICIKSTNW